MELIMAKYGEIALKGLNKRVFEEILVKNIKKSLRGLGEFGYSRMQSTLYITPLGAADLDGAVDRLTKVFGLGAVQRCVKLPKDFSVIVKEGIPYLENSLRRAATFKVEAKRSDKRFPMTSPDIQRELGGEILKAYPRLKVDVREPDATVLLEIRDDGAYLNPERLKGAGGIPVGSSGSALLLLSGGIDSPVAGYMSAKRGVKINALHFQSPPYTSERALMKAEALAGKLTEYCVGVRFICVNFTEIQESAKKRCPEEYLTVILRRLMMRAANALCAEYGCGAIITGESLGQVASQTLSAIACTDKAAEFPVFRPLIGMDKIEIVDLARKIGTFETSSLPYEDCCTIFAPKRPKTKPRVSDAEKIEAAFGYGALIEKAVNERTVKDF
ncbi:MAG: tRNA 4-thiouridine(8) synthase ThiI [Oscillospiraceae bacterium]|jgi:thiamine biosynthesis protein ThiI|nr:tRNA 4-thiouridine(8) synthase ThiI [Oscillospiraceae bacterium]